MADADNADMTFKDLLALGLQTLGAPREGAQRFLDIGWPREAIWPLVGATVALSALMMGTFTMLAPPPEGVTALPPFAYAGFIGVSLVITAAALNWVGRAMGGEGTFHDALVLMSFLQLIMIGLQFVQTFLTMVSVLLGALFFVVSFGMLLWLMINFTAVLHRYSSLGQAGLVLLLALVGTALGFWVILNLTGFNAAGVIANA